MKPKEKEVIEKVAQEIAHKTRGEIASSLARELADKNDYVTEEVLETIISNAIEASIDRGETDDMFVSKIIQTTEGSAGNPLFLSQIHKIQQDRRKILGVYSPELYAIRVEKKIEVKGYRGGWSPDDWDNQIIDGEIEGVKQLPG